MSVDLVLDSRTLKQKRSVVRPLVSQLRRQFGVTSAEAGHLDLLGRTEIGVGVVASDAAHCRDVLDRCQRWLEDQPHVQVVRSQRTYVSDEEMS